MNKKLTLLLLLFCACTVKAQLRGGITAGPAFSLKKRDNDTAFFGRNYFNTQLRAGIHKGRLGLVFSGGMINQNAGDQDPNDRITIDNFGVPVTPEFKGGKVRNTFFTAGPEICFPFGPVRLTVFVAGGISWINAETTTIRLTAPEPIYTTELEKNTSGITKTGAGFNYYLNKHFAFSMNTEYMNYKLKYRNTDKRHQGQAPTIATQNKSIIAVTGGFTYKF